MSFSPVLTFYRGASGLAGAFAGSWLAARARKGKEDPARLNERFGRYPQERPRGRLVWLHGASIGESGIALALAEAMAARDASLSFLITTGTRTSAELVARRALPRTTHMYAPLDRSDCVRRFLRHWRPDVGVFVESELWPNLILGAQRAGVPLALVNARMSPRTLARWTAWRAAGSRLMRAFAWAAAADTRTAAALSALRGADVPALGNLKLAAPAPRVDPGVRAMLAAEIGTRPMWLAASTHWNEDEIALAAHEKLRAETPDALLVIVPRHPERGARVAEIAGGAPRRSKFEPIRNAPVYVADTLGELGAFYDLAPVALVAGSLLGELKGHNPIEPAKLRAAILSGPNVESFDDLFAELFASGGARKVETDDDIADAVATLWRDESARAAQVAAAERVIARGADAFETTVTALLGLALRPARSAADAPA